MTRARIATATRSARVGAAGTSRTWSAKSLRLALIALALAIVSPIVATAQTVSFQGLGFLPGTSPSGSWATAISSGGSVVVGYDDYSGGLAEAFSWTAGTMTPLGFPGGTTQSRALGANSNGSVIVGYSSGSVGFPVIWVNGTPTILPQSTNPNAGNAPCGAVVYGVDANATALGSSVIAGQDATPGCGPGVATEWINGSEINIFPNPISICGTTSSGLSYGASGDGSVVVGSVGYCYQVNSSIEVTGTAFIYNNKSGSPTFIDPPTASSPLNSTAYAANSDGTVVVGTIDAPGSGGVTQNAFRWTQATGLVTLGPAATFASALAVSADGSVVVGNMGNPGPAFRWTAATGFQNLQTLLTANGAGASLNGWSLMQATGVSADGTEIVGRGTGPGSMAQAWIAHVPVAATTIGVNAHDFNGDGKSDILWRNANGTLAAWLMNGGTISQSAGLGTVTAAFSIIGQHDFDGDGKADVLWRDSSGNVSLWFMNGAAVSSAAAVGNLTSNWTLYGTGDLNGDGKGDLLWRDSGSGTVAVWFMNGATVASTAVFGALPSNWTIVGDANGDILWRDTAGDIALWGVQNGQVTSSSGLGTVTSNFVVQGVGDFNGDGKIDILWRDTNSGALSIWFTNGTQVTSGALVGTLPSNWSVAQVGDYNGDAKSDILLLDSAGDLAVWLMNGATVSSSVGIGNVGTTWQVQNLNDN